jgi:DNA replication protein DnaC
MLPMPARICEPCAIKEANERHTQHILSTVPQAFHWASFTSPGLLLARVQNKAAVVLARESLDEPRVVLTGRAGDGKTSLLVAMLRAWDERRYRDELGRFSTSWRLGRSRLRHGLGEGEPDEVRFALRTALLALDDIGSEGRVPNGSATFDVIFDRHESSKPTWVTTAMSVADMRDLYGDGFTRRIFEHARIIDCAPQAP